MRFKLNLFNWRLSTTWNAIFSVPLRHGFLSNDRIHNVLRNTRFFFLSIFFFYFGNSFTENSIYWTFWLILINLNTNFRWKMNFICGNFDKILLTFSKTSMLKISLSIDRPCEWMDNTTSNHNFILIFDTLNCQSLASVSAFYSYRNSTHLQRHTVFGYWVRH